MNIQIWIYKKQTLSLIFPHTGPDLWGLRDAVFSFPQCTSKGGIVNSLGYGPETAIVTNKV